MKAGRHMASERTRLFEPSRARRLPRAGQITWAPARIEAGSPVKPSQATCRTDDPRSRSQRERVQAPRRDRPTQRCGRRGYRGARAACRRDDRRSEVGTAGARRIPAPEPPRACVAGRFAPRGGVAVAGRRYAPAAIASARRGYRGAKPRSSRRRRPSIGATKARPASAFDPSGGGSPTEANSVARSGASSSVTL